MPVKNSSKLLKMARDTKLKQEAEANTTAVKKSNGGTETIKQGAHFDHANQTEPQSCAKVGMSKGVTKNMDNYESLRVDVWLSDTVMPGESVEEAYLRIENIINETLEAAVLSTIGE